MDVSNRAVSLPALSRRQAETTAESPADNLAVERGRRAASLAALVDKRNHTFGRLSETSRRGRVLGAMKVSHVVGDLGKLKHWALNSTIDFELAENPEVLNMTNVVARASKYCIICEHIASKINAGELHARDARNLERSVRILESMHLGLDQGLWSKGCKSHVYKLLPDIKEVLFYREPLRILADTFWDFLVARDKLAKQQEKLQSQHKCLSRKERALKTANNQLKEDARKIQRMTRTAIAEVTAADEEASKTATAAASEAAKALANKPPPGVRVSKSGTEEALTASVAARTAAHATGVRVKWRVELRSAEIAHEQSRAASDRVVSEVAAAKEAVAAEVLAEKHAAFVAREAEMQYCSTWLIAMEDCRLSHSLETLICKWFSEMPNARQALLKLLHDDVRFCYRPGLEGDEDLEQSARDRLVQLGVSNSNLGKLDLRMSKCFAGIHDRSNVVVVVTGPSNLLADVRRLASERHEPAIVGAAFAVETPGQVDERAEAFLRRAGLD